jgi:hypothetical protein
VQLKRYSLNLDKVLSEEPSTIPKHVGDRAVWKGVATVVRITERLKPISPHWLHT